MVGLRMLATALFVAALAGCAGIPEGIEPVKGFELARFLGTWYEIARLDHPFERGLERVTAHYALRPDGTIEVVNRGFDPARGEWREARGRARFAGDPGVGALRVTFFGPFYGAYNVIALDREGYQYALVCGADRDFLWLLARTPDPEPEVVESLIATARGLGFATERLLFVRHGPGP